MLAFGATPAFAQVSPPPGLQAPAAGPIASLFSGSPATAPQPAVPDAVLSSASAEVRSVARWIANSHDNAGLPYLLVDKVNAEVLAFGADGTLRAVAPALLGMSPGDKLKVSSDTTMAQMSDQDRITPAGRYLSRLAIDSDGKELLAIDYVNSISLHPVVKGTPAEHRAERLASPTSQDNRVSFGCINVPPAFYSEIVSPAFANRRGLVYILPETSPAAQVFGFEPDAEAPGLAARASATAPDLSAHAPAKVATTLLELPVDPLQPAAISVSAPNAVPAPDLR